ncbi:hypothetical protein [Bradyrhizobium vignae]|uniref:hypothetical protein n=1 Tax=Bradyrhizobium vignae TaxID=1549949 RepID=UPI000F003C50|nr:hypothetical protein [Bradyrhizobium vignae]
MRKIAIACIVSGIISTVASSAYAADGIKSCQYWYYSCVKWVIENRKTLADKLKGYDSCRRTLAVAKSSGSFYMEAQGMSLPCSPSAGS